VKKLLHHWLELDSLTATEFENEVRILTKLRHPNIVQFFGAGKPDTYLIRLDSNP